MIRRPLLAACALTAALALTSCSTFSANDDVARVNGAELTQDELGAMLDSALGQALLQDAPIGGEVRAETARRLIGLWTAVTAIVDTGVVVADPASAEPGLAAQFGDSWTSAPEVLKQLEFDFVAVTDAIEAGELTEDEVYAIVADADISIDSRYGDWDDEQLAVVALG